MAPPRRPWFRFYTEALTDPKLRRLSVEERWLWVAVLGAARQSPVPGWLMLTEALPLSNDDLAELAGMTPAKVERGLAKMLDLQIVILDVDTGAYRVKAWADRQFESDDTTSRTRRHRRNSNQPTMERSIVDEGTSSESETETENRSSSSSSSTTRPTAEGPEEEDGFANEVWDRIARGRLQRSSRPKTNPDGWLTTVRSNVAAEKRHELARLRAEFPDLTPSHAASALEGDPSALQYLTRVEA